MQSASYLQLVIQAANHIGILASLIRPTQSATYMANQPHRQPTIKLVDCKATQAANSISSQQAASQPHLAQSGTWTANRLINYQPAIQPAISPIISHMNNQPDTTQPYSQSDYTHIITQLEYHRDQSIGLYNQPASQIAIELYGQPIASQPRAQVVSRKANYSHCQSNIESTNKF